MRLFESIGNDAFFQESLNRSGGMADGVHRQHAMKTEEKQAKKALNLSIKTLETRIAPGACRDSHNAWAESGDPTSMAQWNDPHAGVSDGGKGAAVPVIGIN